MQGWKWTEAHDEVMRRIAAEGKPTVVAATELGITRNMVIGRARRAGIVFAPRNENRTPRKNKPRAASGQYKIAKPRRPVHGPRSVKQKSWASGGLPQSSTPKAPYVEPPNFDIGTKTLLELKWHGECHWPIGNPKDPDFLFCGAPVINEQTGEVDVTRVPHYCTGHFRRACAAKG